MNSPNKISRSQLKQLVKECLVEILQEGLSSPLAPSTPAYAQQERLPLRAEVTNRKPAAQQKRISPLDMPATNHGLSQDIREAIKREVAGSPNKSVMSEIFADTANRTLPGLMSDGGGDPHRLTLQEQFHGTPEEIFGEEASSKWAELAFASPVKKIS